MCLRLLLGAALFGISLAGAYGQQQGFNLDQASGKLPKHVLPHAYKIELVPDLAQLSIATGRETVGFVGSVQIDIEVRQAVEQIIVNANDISIARATVDGAESKVEIDRHNQTATVRPPQTLDVGRHTLAIEYSGTILTHQEGLFYSTYDTPAGQRWVLATDLEPAGARRIFPGWDEPAFKATFRLSVTVPATFRALSNMPVVREHADGASRKIVTFATTPRMSSYLFVLAAGEYDRIATTWQASISASLFRVIRLRRAATRSTWRRVRSRISMNISASNIRCPSSTMFWCRAISTGAMENWGGVIYSERALLFDEAIGSEDDRKVVHEYVVHETGAPVVRQSRHHGVVGRTLAQRRFCFVDGKEAYRRVQSLDEGLGAHPRRQGKGHGQGCVTHRASGAAAGRG